MPLWRVYFSHFTTKQGTIVKDICYRLGAQFCSVCSPSGLIYYGHAKRLFKKQRSCASFSIICNMKFFQYIPIVNIQQETIMFWCKKILRHLLRGALSKKVFCKVQLKPLKIYMKVNPFLLLSWSLENLWYNVLIVLVGHE